MNTLVENMQNALARGYVDAAGLGVFGFLGRAFNTGCGVQPTKPQDFAQPALALERASGMTGLSENYTLPENISAYNLQVYAQLVMQGKERGNPAVSQARLDKLSEVTALLVTLNPQLEKLQFDHSNGWKQYDVILGVASGFRVDDIQFYLDGNTLTTEKTADYRTSMENVKKILDLQWIPSLPTLQAVEQQLSARISSMAAPKPPGG